MQHTPDKDFDNLFRDKLIDAEIEPSANLWAKIEDQLAPKRKRITPIYWMAAASIAIVIGAMLVLQKTEKIQLRDDDATTSIEKPVVQDVVTTVDEISSTNLGALKVKVQIAAAIKNEAPENNIENIQEALQPNPTLARLLIKRADPKPIDVSPITLVENPIVIAQVEPQESINNVVIDEIDNTRERKGIRNVGDLVNYVVDKVDKRDKKLLRFTTDDDDNSSIIGINIGFLKLNKKNK